MWEESENRTPLICFLSMGSDPTDNIERLAKSKNISRLYLWRVPNVLINSRFFLKVMEMTYQQDRAYHC